jgi:hypothetical protein
MSTNVTDGAGTMEAAAASANISPAETPAPEAQPDTTDDAGRPDWLPEKFWSTGNGPQYEELAKSYSELEQWRMKSREDAMTHFKDEIIAETKGEIPEGVPTAVDGYEINFDREILPEGLDFDPDVSDPLLDWWRNHCFENQLPQNAFESGINAFLKSDMETIPDYDAEISKLGENGTDRFGNVMRWLNANASEKTVKTINGQKMSADLIEALEDIQSKSTGTIPSRTEGVAQMSGPNEDDLRKMQMEPGYINGSDPGLIRKVTEGYARLATQGRRAS